MGSGELENKEGKMFFNPYTKPINSSRSGPIYRSHSYPTKINYRSIVPFILAHTEPGDVVYDSFAGTCSTGIAAAACSKKDESLLSYLDEEAKSSAEWGKRKSICLDIGVLPTFIGKTLLNPIDSDEFISIFNEIMDEIEKKWGWIYQAEDENGDKGEIRYTYWSEVVRCPKCGEENHYMDIFVDFKSGNFLSEGVCPNCSQKISKREVEPIFEEVYDKILDETREAIKRVPVMIYGETDGKKWSREFKDKDIRVLKEIEKKPVPEWINPIPILSGDESWGELHRSGYHKNISYLHHFYTPRNFLALSVLHDKIKNLDEDFKRAFKFIISSYNTGHSTLMTRFVFKSGKNKPVNTSAQPGALYVPSCPVEKNIFRGVKRKLRQFKKVVETVQKWEIDTKVYTRPAQKSRLDPESVDYIFTDPPFGNNIQYSEINFISEAWLNSFTYNNRDKETIISDFQNKTLSEYEELLKEAFRENYRVLKENCFMTVVFHSRKKKIWNSLRRAIIHSGFEIVNSSILDKTQSSFKQTTTKGAVKKDPIIVAMKTTGDEILISEERKENVEEFISRRLENHGTLDEKERTFDYLFSRYVGKCIMDNGEVDLNADEFKQTLKKVAVSRDGIWYLKEDL